MGKDNNKISEEIDKANVLVQAKLAILNSHLGHLRSIKDMEMAWIDRYSILIIPAIGYVVTHKDSFGKMFIAFISIFYFLLTCWIQIVLKKERKSYYGVMLSVIRLENTLGLFKSFLSPSMQNAPFPEGIGPDVKKDGTQRFSSFFHRILYTFFLLASLYCGIIYSSFYKNDVRIVFSDLLIFLFLGLLLFLDILFIVYIFISDKKELYKSALGQKEKEGFEASWIPSSK